MKINRSRLGYAMGLGIFPMGYNPHRCELCGRIELDCIVYYEEKPPLRCICRNHGGPDGKTYVDALTGCKIIVGPEPSFARRVVSNLMHENLYWLSVAVKYAWYTIYDGFLVWVLYPVKAIEYARYKRKSKKEA